MVRKYAQKRSASSVADATMTRSSGRRRRIFFSSPSSRSVYSVRSWASSTMTTEYRDSSGSNMASRNSRPSVMYLIRVAARLDRSSKRTA